MKKVEKLIINSPYFEPQQAFALAPGTEIYKCK